MLLGASVLLAPGCALAWQDQEISIVEVGPDDTTLTVGYHCHMDSSLDAVETGDEIRLSLRTYDAAIGDCADVEQVTLDDPLADRRIVDTATGDEVEPCRPAQPGGPGECS